MMKRGVIIALAIGGCANTEPPAAPAAASGDIEITVKPAEPRSAPEPTASASESSVAVPVEAEDSDLSPTCRSYVRRITACSRASVASAPPDARRVAEKTIEDAMRTTLEAWKRMPAAELEQACTAALAALSQNPACPE
ncbi:MAG: hypothetical protein JNK04_04170 [Myxococcales bacterium]|nr:hypothetical protein [Myxococcales bacterium]